MKFPQLLPKDPKKRRMAIMLALGAGVVILLLVRRSQAAAAGAGAAATDAAAAGTDTAGMNAGAAGAAGATPADPLAGGSAGGVDNSSQLAGFETDLLNQLPDTISSAIAAGFANGIPAPDTAGAASSDGAGTTLNINMGTGHGGAKHHKSKKPGGGQNVKKHPHPTGHKAPAHKKAAAKKPAAHKPAAHKPAAKRPIAHAAPPRAHSPAPTGRAHKRHG